MWAVKVEAYSGGDWWWVYNASPCLCSSRKEERHRFASREEARASVARRGEPCRYKLVRLVTKREKLKRKLLREQGEYERRANVEAKIDRNSAYCGWYRGYARALRDVAGQL